MGRLPGRRVLGAFFFEKDTNGGGRFFFGGGGGPNKDIGFPRGGGSYPPATCAVFLGGGVGLTPQEAEEGQTPQKLRLERGKEANDSQFPLESHFFTTNFINKKIYKTSMKNLKNVEIANFF